MPIERARLDQMIAKMDTWLKQKNSENTDPKQFKESAPQQPFNDSPPEMPKVNLWGGKPPIPIEHL
jgi:hypothetical protein